MAMATPFITRVVLKNYKSIQACDVPLTPVTYLVGRNGSGKSSFLEALRFVADALRNGLDNSVKEAGGMGGLVPWKWALGAQPGVVGIRLEFKIDDDLEGVYACSIGPSMPRSYAVQEELCQVRTKGDEIAQYRVRGGMVVGKSVDILPAAFEDRLLLVAASGLPEFRPVFDALSQMVFYNLVPDQMRQIRPSNPDDLLAPDGANIGSVLARLAKDKDTNVRLGEYLEALTPNIHEAFPLSVKGMPALVFRCGVAKPVQEVQAFASSMSDGTLRFLGILVALFQPRDHSGARVRLVGIEEPENALHPAALALVRDAMRETAEHTQVLVTSHSSDLLEDELSESESILSVIMEDGITSIAPLSSVAKSALRDHLFTPGELLRVDQLDPDTEQIARSRRGPSDLFSVQESER
jgi:predicted ATPase